MTSRRNAKTLETRVKGCSLRASPAVQAVLSCKDGCNAKYIQQFIAEVGIEWISNIDEREKSIVSITGVL